MPNPKLIFWIVVALCVSLTLTPDTIVKMMAIYWLWLIGVIGFVRFCFWCAKRKGAVKVTFTENEPLVLSVEWPNCTCRPSQKMGRTKTGWKCPACGETRRDDA